MLFRFGVYVRFCLVSIYVLFLGSTCGLCWFSFGPSLLLVGVEFGPYLILFALVCIYVGFSWVLFRFHSGPIWELFGFCWVSSCWALFGFYFFVCVRFVFYLAPILGSMFVSDLVVFYVGLYLVLFYVLFGLYLGSVWV